LANPGRWSGKRETGDENLAGGVGEWGSGHYMD